MKSVTELAPFVFPIGEFIQTMNKVVYCMNAKQEYVIFVYFQMLISLIQLPPNCGNILSPSVCLISLIDASDWLIS